MKYYVYEKTPGDDEFNTILKCRQDIRSILEESGYIPIHVPTYDLDEKDEDSYVKHTAKTGMAIGKNFKLWMERLKDVKSDDVVFIQYPPLNYTLLTTVLLWLKTKGVYIIGLIHDLEAYRDSKEVGFFKNWSYYEDTTALTFFNQIIVQNVRMRKLLMASEYDDKKLINLRLFDYITPKSFKTDTRTFDKDAPIVLAGNFHTTSDAKLHYIYTSTKDPGVKFRIYGTGVEDELIQNLTYEYAGSYPAIQMPDKLEGSFGLVWDGNSLDTCSGSWGEYLRIDNPLRFSMYLAAGLPVITWTDAALAGFVKKYNIGFVISSIYELESKLAAITKEEYEQMRLNVKPFSQAVREGVFFKKALERAELRL